MYNHPASRLSTRSSVHSGALRLHGLPWKSWHLSCYSPLPYTLNVLPFNLNIPYPISELGYVKHHCGIVHNSMRFPESDLKLTNFFNNQIHFAILFHVITDGNQWSCACSFCIWKRSKINKYHSQFSAPFSVLLCFLPLSEWLCHNYPFFAENNICPVPYPQISRLSESFTRTLLVNTVVFCIIYCVCQFSVFCLCFVELWFDGTDVILSIPLCGESRIFAVSSTRNVSYSFI